MKYVFMLSMMFIMNNSAIASQVQTIKVIDDLKRAEAPVKKEFDKTDLILFKVNRSELTESSKKQLKLVAKTYLQYKDKQPLLISVIGHTDKIGSLEHNLELSKKRAVNAANYLIDNGVDVNDLTVNYIADQNPAAGERNSLIERSAEVTIKTL